MNRNQEIAQLKAKLDTAIANYEALAAGEYKVDRADNNLFRRTIFTVSAEAHNSTITHTIAECTTDTISQAKVIESALRAAFPSANVKTTIKCDINDHNDRTFKEV